MTGVTNNVRAILFWMHFHTGLFHPNTGEMGADFLWAGGEGWGQGEWLQLQRQTEPGTQYTIEGLDSQHGCE